MSIGGRIKYLRKAVNLTQEEFAQRLRISKGFLSNLEKEIRRPSDQLVLLIAYEYSSSEDWILKGEGEMFLSVEDVVKKQIVHFGERAYYEAIQKILDDNGLIARVALTPRTGGHDPDLNQMLYFFIDLWATGDEDLKAWAKVQFGRAFPQDIKDEVQKKLGADDRNHTSVV